MDKQKSMAEHAAWHAQVSANAYLPIVTAAKHVSDYCVWLMFDDGTEGLADLSDIIHRSGKFAALADRDYFATVAYDAEIHTISWSNGLDLSPESLYRRVKKTQETH